jgi:hypothetical protein
MQKVKRRQNRAKSNKIKHGEWVTISSKKRQIKEV